jgi:hypothetical protein
LNDSHDGERCEALLEVNEVFAVYCGARTVAKKPQTLVINKSTVDTRKKGLLPQIFAPDAVKNVVKPIQKTENPIRRLEAMSKLTAYFSATICSPGVTMGPNLRAY